MELGVSGANHDAVLAAAELGQTGNVIKRYKAKKDLEKEPIKLRYGTLKKLAAIFGVSEQTVRRALAFRHDTELAEQIRIKAYRMNFVRYERTKL